MSDAAFGTLQRSLADPVGHNPFVPISDAMRLVVISYFIIWRLVPTLAVLSAQSSVAPGYALTIALLQFATEVLILLPFLVKRFAGTPIGWLHPLILPTMVSVTFGILRRPEALLAPITVWSQAQAVPEHALLFGWPELRILEAQLKLNLINLLALVCTYAGFAIVLRRHRQRVRPPIRIDGTRVAILFVLMVLIVFAFLQMQGGLIAHMSVLGGGRFRMRELSGHFLVVNAFLPYLLLLWYAYMPSALRTPIFIAAFALSAALQFVVTGSRSGLFAPLALLLAVWIYHNRRLPATRALLLGLVAVLLLGVLGEVRRSGRDGQIDFTALTQFDLTTAWEVSQEEQANRSRDTGLAVAALVPEHRGHLLGTTYVAAAAFWIPRFIWRDKPRGAGAHAAALLFGGRETMEGYTGGGFPVNSAPEAYWNFSYPGVIIVHLVHGIVLGFFARWLLRDPDNPFAIVALMIIVFDAAQPNSISLTSAFQRLGLLYVSYLVLTQVTFRR